MSILIIFLIIVFAILGSGLCFGKGMEALSKKHFILAGINFASGLWALLSMSILIFSKIS